MAGAVEEEQRLRAREAAASLSDVGDRARLTMQKSIIRAAASVPCARSTCRGVRRTEPLTASRGRWSPSPGRSRLGTSIVERLPGSSVAAREQGLWSSCRRCVHDACACAQAVASVKGRVLD